MNPARSRIALLAAAVLTLALIASVAWQWSASPSTATAASPSEAARGADEVATQHELAPLPAPSELRRNEAPVVLDTPRVAVEHVGIATTHFATVVLAGTIEADRGDLQLAQVALHPSWTGSNAELRFHADMHGDFDTSDKHAGWPLRLEVQARADGSFEFDVTKLIQMPGSLPPRIAPAIFVTVLHPKLASVTEKVLVPSLERLQHETRIELTTVVRMRQSIATLLGHAWTIDGVAVTIQVGALDSQGASADPAGRPAKQVAKDSSFSLQVVAPAEYAIVAVAEGYRPCSLRVSVDPGTDVTLPPLVLDRGHTIRGRVRLAARSSAAGATIAAQPAGSFTRVQVAGKALACFDDTFEWATRSARVDASGEYELNGLGPRTYSVSTSSVPGAYLGHVTARDFVAPCAGADLTLGGVCEVHVEFIGTGKPGATRFGVRQQRAVGGSCFGVQESAADGQVTLFIEPGATTSIVVPGSEGERVFAVPACSAGRVVAMRIDL